jgi:hypothetical protein
LTLSSQAMMISRSASLGFGGVLGWHVVGLDAGGGALPLIGEGGVAGGFEGGVEVDATAGGAAVLMAGRAVGFDDGSDAAFEVCFGFGLAGFVVDGLGVGGEDEAE